MLNVDLRNVLGKHTSRYSLVTATAKRAREIVDLPAPEPTGKKTPAEKPVSVAIDEIIAGKYVIVEPEEIRNL
ncbi:MAG: DNA-directed RNA polymerase subunit omega [Oscillospiraceae bacterium]|jgi:DNA-directed RNA polymerase omega subunit|nr:DNA-directed RNA polymerase subunit omega [Oscillospiraceae bacterium]